MTKVSKPVLFALKMTDFQCAHKQESLSHKPMLARYFGRTPGYFPPNPGRQSGFQLSPEFHRACAREGRLPLVGEAPLHASQHKSHQKGRKMVPLTP